MRVLFLSCEAGLDRSTSAYSHRLRTLMGLLQRHDVDTRFVSLREQRVRRPLLAHILNVPQLCRAVSDCDFIHAGGNATYTAVGLRPFTRARIIHDVHGDSVSEGQIKSAARPTWRSRYELAQAWLVDAAAYRYADFSLVVSRPSWQRLIRERHVPSDRIGLVRNGVDLEQFSRPPKRRVAGADLVVAYAGGFQPWQGIDNLVQAIEQVPRGVRLKIIGFSAEHESIRADVARRLGARCELLDRMPQSQLVSQLASADALVIPRPWHRAVEVAFPTKFGEYLALGKPVIVCDVDETADLVRQHACGLVASPTPSALAAALVRMAALNPDQLHHMGANARRLAERELSWDLIGRQYAALLSKWSATP